MAEMMPQVGKVQPYQAFKYETVVVHTTVIHFGLSLVCSNENNRSKNNNNNVITNLNV